MLPRVLPVGLVLLGLMQAAGEVRAMGEVALIPRKVLFSNPDRAAPQISPDGKQIAFLAPVRGVLNVWVAPARKPEQAQVVTKDKKRGIHIFFWAFTSRHILYLQDQAGDENWRVYAVDLATGKTRDLTPVEKVHAEIAGVSERKPAEIVVGLNDRNPQFHDLYLVNIETGERKLLAENQGFAGLMVDDDYLVRFAMRVLPNGGAEFLKPKEGGGWEAAVQIEPEDAMTTHPIGFSRDGKWVYTIDTRGRDTAALTKVNAESFETRLIAADQEADIDSVMVHPTKKTVQAVGSTYERRHWKVLDRDIAGDLAYLKTVADGDVDVTSRSQEDKWWTVAYVLDNGPVRYYLYDREKKQAKLLFTNRKALEGLTLARTYPVIIKSRDGLNLVSYLTLPPGSEVKGKARPGKPLPMILSVHGGPWARDEWGYNGLNQWLANRGYAVLQVNYRGSTGFGKAFVNAADREWGGKMHDDLIDAVKWAEDQKIADAGKVAILGGSYGGYATLVGMTFTPEVFACGVDLVGISNLTTFMKTIPPYWAPVLAMFRKRVGDPSTEEGLRFLASRSPINKVGEIVRPLLIGQGQNDPRVNRDEADQIVKAMQERKIPVTYVLYPDEGHGFARPENNLSFFAIGEAFLAAHLGGRYEPIGDDFKGSSLRVLTGAGSVPGLEMVLPPGP
jgi:dipeptidyl aminopeptidase/acylaminoacyl peptidase